MRVLGIIVYLDFVWFITFLVVDITIFVEIDNFDNALICCPGGVAFFGYAC